MDLHHVPDDVVCDVLIVVPKHVADSGDLPPWHIWLSNTQRLGHMAAGLGDDLQFALDGAANDASPTIVVK